QQGNYGIYATAILDLKTGVTEILTMGGSAPAWSPDGGRIAFVRLRENLSIDTVTSETRAADKFVAMNRPPSNQHEVWVVDLATRDMRYLADGVGPLVWSRDSARLYFGSSEEQAPAAWCVALADQPPAPRRIFQGQGTLPPAVAPNERYVADAVHRWLRVFELPSQRVVAEWLAPPFPLDIAFHWSPDSRELGLQGSMGEMTGAWVLDLRTGTVRRMLPRAATGVWSPDRSRMIVCPEYPYSGLWLFDLDPNRPTAEALGDGGTVEDCCRAAIAYYSRGIAADPNHIDSHLRRTDAALSLRDPNAPRYLEELEDAMRRSPYRVAGCTQRMRLILASPPELRDRLAPLALLLARMSVEKDIIGLGAILQRLRRAGLPTEAVEAVYRSRRGGLQGSMRHDPARDTYTVAAVGVNIWNYADDFHFAYKTLHGDGSIVARVDGFQKPDEWSKAGVMIRESLAAGSRHAFCCLLAGHGTSFHHRTETDQATGQSNTEGFAAPYWVKLVREGNTLSAYHSRNGKTWTLQPATAKTPNPQTIVMGPDVCIGLAVTSQDPSRIVEVRFSHVRLTGSVAPPGPFTESCDISLPLSLPAGQP
ncbi:MAG: hypothetical protein MUC88_15725, partial [Planctomycetes bacterium]|nr:hypothetical protein [Planctomycetota bacterium]